MAGSLAGPRGNLGSTCSLPGGPRAEDAAACFAGRPAGYPRAWSGDWPSVGAQDVLRRIFEGHHRAAVRHPCDRRNLGVREDLYQQWAHDGGDLAAQAPERVRRVTAKAWRFAGEMDEIAATFGDAGMPEGFHAAAAIVYRRLAQFKAAQTTPTLDDVLGALPPHTGAGQVISTISRKPQ